MGAAKTAEKLLEVLSRYGELFASDLIIGGRLTYWPDKKLQDTYSAKLDRKQFEQEAVGMARPRV